MKKKAPILIFDTNIFLTGIDFNVINGTIYTTPNVIEEIKVERYLEKNRNILNKIQAAILSKKLILKTPSESFFKNIEEKSRNTGDLNVLSHTDKELLALALELIEKSDQNVRMYTNDYSIENICSKLNIPFSPIFKEGIKKMIIWEIYCPFCKIIYHTDDLQKNCERCGSPLKRRPNRNKH